MPANACSIPDCESAVIARGYCNAHYRRFMRGGDPLGKVGTYAKSPEEKFEKHLEQGPNGCILWNGLKTHNGYGVFGAHGRTARAHRYAWERVNGAIPEGQIIDHSCHNRNCVNVDHMRIATYKHNMENRKGANKNSSTGVRGVTRYRDTGRWRGVVKHDRHSYHVGIFDTIEEAEAAVIAKRAELFTHSDRDRVI